MTDPSQMSQADLLDAILALETKHRADSDPPFDELLRLRRLKVALTERYRGTEFDTQWHTAAVGRNTGISRGRAFVVVGLLAAAGLYGIVLGVLGMV